MGRFTYRSFKLCVNLSLLASVILHTICYRAFHSDLGLSILVHYLEVRLRLHGTIYCPDSFVLMLRYCLNLKAIRYESTNLNRIVADISHRVICSLIR